MAASFAVLRGGPSPDHKASIKSGQVVLDVLRDRQGMHRDIYIDREGVWNERGRPVSPEQVLRLVDGVINTLHGPYGEDGTVQKLLRQHAMPFSGSEALPSFFASHKALAKEMMAEEGLETPRYFLVESPEDRQHKISEAIRHLGHLLIVKSIYGEGGHWVRVCTSAAEIEAAVDELLTYGPVLLEEYIRGREATLFLVEGFRGDDIYTCSPLEIAREGNQFVQKCPGSFSRIEREQLEVYARHIFKTLGLRHYGKIDFLVTPHTIYFLEANSLPKIHNRSLFKEALEAMGGTQEEFVRHLEGLALKG